MHHFSAVAVIQSLRTVDKKTGTTLMQNVVGPRCGAAGLTSWFYDVSTGSELLGVLDRLASDCAVAHHSPIVHFETHGGDDGLQATNNDLVSWEQLRKPLERLNRICRLNLLVTLAACDGSKLTKILKPSQRAPVWGIVGPKTSRDAPDLLEEYSRFFDELLVSQDGRKALEALNGGPPDKSWPYAFIPAQYMFRIVLQRYRREEMSPEALERRATNVALQATLGDTAGMQALDAVKAAALAELSDLEPFFERFKTLFFMLDMFAENAQRFDLKFADL